MAVPNPTLILSLLALLSVLALRHRITDTLPHSPGSATLGRVLETRGGEPKTPKKRWDSRERGRASRWRERSRARASAPSSRVKRSSAPREEAVATVEKAYDRCSANEINALPLGQWLLYSTENGQVMYSTVVQTYLPPTAESVGRVARLRRMMGTRS
jgi:hypothetical protein